MINLFKVLMSPLAGDKVKEVLYSGHIAQGSKVEEFEKALEPHLGKVLTVNSGTSAIELALHLCGVDENSEVITTPKTCTATNGHILHRGAKIVWADVFGQTGNIHPGDIIDKITSKTKAIIAVDWAGRPCDYASLRKVAKGIPIIQDAAHGFSKGQGDYVCYSFQAIKFLTTGDGGAIRVPEHQYQRAKLLRWFGLDRESSASFRCAQDIKEVGFKHHMNDISASIGLANLDYAIAALQDNKENAEFLYENLYYISRAAGHFWFKMPPFDPNASYWFFPILVSDKDEFIKYMANEGIEVSPVHARNDKHTGFGGLDKSLSGLNYFEEHAVGIPCGWWLTKTDLRKIIDAMYDWTYMSLMETL
jgi:dTDP-4-amino-4,6-dideoxygalactose transaminase